MRRSLLASSRSSASGPPLPRSCGPLSAFVVEHLQRPAHALGELPALDGPWDGDDIQLALYTCYELHYRGFASVDERWEWHPGLLSFRAALEEVFEAGVRAAVGPASVEGPVEDQLWALAQGGSGPSL